MEQLSSEAGGRPFEGIFISGIALRTILDGFQSASELAGRRLMEEGLGEPGTGGRVVIEPLAWYPLERCLKVIRELSATLGDTVLVQIGQDVAEALAPPPWVRDVHEALRSLDTSYHASYRRHGQSMLDPVTGQLAEGIGHYGYERVGERRVVSVVSSPYPCPFNRGLLTAWSRRFQPRVWVFHDDARPCRKRGSESCAYHVTWL